MVASVPEMQAAGNQKQCFDMLVVRLMRVVDIPPISELVKQTTTPAPQVKQQTQKVPVKDNSYTKNFYTD